MILPCEVAVKSVIPAVKALMAKKLVEEYGLKQEQAARILGVSQSGVSKYTHKVRGHAIEVDRIEEVHPLVNEMVVLLMEETYDRAKVIQLFCQACVIVRRTSIMCDFCVRSDPEIKTRKCGSCIEARSRRR